MKLNKYVRASDWLARYHKEGIDGLENRPRSGSPSKLPGEVAAV
ncbi:MAG: helix-turn-helix domain-containing protein, partial [Nitrososphaeraceae archaeon]